MCRQTFLILSSLTCLYLEDISDALGVCPIQNETAGKSIVSSPTV